MKTRKLLPMLLLAVCMHVIFLLPQKAYASEMIPVIPNETFYGTLETADTAHYYSFTVDKQGYFNINFSVEDITADTKDGWKVELYNEGTGQCIYSKVLTSNTVLPTYNFKKGTKLYLSVSGEYFIYTSDVPVGQRYSVNIKTVEDKSWEQEGNDTADTSTPVVAGKTYNGNLYWYNDVDYYKYKVDHFGYFNIDFSVADVTVDAMDGWKVELYNAATGKCIYSNMLTTNATLPSFNFKKGTELYIAISEDYFIYTNEVPVWQQYSINIKTVEDKSWEQESLISSDESWSSRSKSATSISLGKKYNGNMCVADDNDLYKFSIDKNGYVTVKFDPDDVEANTGEGYVVNILTKTGTKVSENVVKSVANIKTYLKKGTYYIEISRRSSYSPLLKRYIVSATHKAKMPAQVSSIKKKGTIVSWKKISDADGYEICYATNKNFKKATKISLEKSDTNSYELYGLQERKTYYVRVRAYKNAGAYTKVYGEWSSTVKVKKK